MFQIDLTKDELLEELRGKDLTPELIADLIDRNNAQILKLLVSGEFMEYINNVVVEKVLREIRT